MEATTVGDVRMAYEDAGAGAPVLLVHGFPLGRWMWSAQREALSRRYRVLTPDLRGHGDSTVTPGPYTMDLLADDLAGFCDRLGLARVILGGLSMGGYVALAFWRKYPDRVRALLLCDTKARADDAEQQQQRTAGAGQVLAHGTAAFVEGQLPRLLGAGTLKTRPALCEEVRARLSRTDPAGVAAALLGMRARPDSTPTLATITVPTLVLVGRDDALTPPSIAAEMRDGIRGASLSIIEGAGHLAPVEQPAAVNAALERFLATLPAA
jgi:pimeloyl-ACP methyl ester carboxylesterase